MVVPTTGMRGNCPDGTNGVDGIAVVLVQMTAELAVVSDTPLTVPVPHPGANGLLAG